MLSSGKSTFVGQAGHAQLSRRSWVLLVPFLLYSAASPVVASLYVPLEARVAAYNIRPYVLIGMAVVVIAAATMGFVSSARSWLGSSRRLIAAALAFPAYYSFASVAKGTFNVAVAGQYLLWAILAFATMPALLLAPDVARRVARALFIIGVLQLSVLVGSWAVLGDEGHLFGDRVSFGLSNPNLFAQVPQLCFASFGMWWALSRPRAGRWWRVGWIGVSTGAVALAAAARSRNVLAFLIVAGMSYALQTLYAKRLRGAAIALSMAMVAGLAGAFVATEAEALDVYSSGRIRIWRAAVDSAIREAPVSTAIWGPAQLPGLDVGAYDTASSEKEFVKFHIDNSYLELLFEAGGIGLLLFLWPYSMVVGGGLRELRRTAGARAVTKWSLSLLAGLAAQCAFASMIPTFNNVMAVFFLLFGAAAGWTSAGRPAATSGTPQALGAIGSDRGDIGVSCRPTSPGRMSA